MGEQIHSYTSANTWLPIMRSSRGKMFMYVVVLGGMGFVIFLLSSVHSNLRQMESSNEKCQQQRDSLSAQLQVVYEHKNRLERSLQQEKTDHRHTKEEHDKQLSDRDARLQLEKDKRQSVESQLTQLKSSYAELEVDKKHAENLIKEQLQTMQAQKEQEIKKLQVHISKLIEEKDKVEQEKATLAWKVDQNINEASMCNQQVELLQRDLNKCREEVSKTPTGALNLGHGIDKQEKDNDVVGAGQVNVPLKVAFTPTKEKANVLPKPNILDEKAADAFQKSLNGAKNNLSDIHSVNPAVDTKDVPDVNDVRRVVLPNNNNNMNEMNNPLYQFQPPDSQNQAAERGEYANAVQPQQVEKPVRDPSLDSPFKNNIPVPADNALAQARYMLENSPDENPANKKSGSNQFLGGDLDERMNNKLNGNVGVPKPDHELPDMDEKHQYDDDDDDQDADNEDNVGGGQGHQDRQFNEQDFVDQESKDNPKREEGVMLSPK